MKIRAQISDLPEELSNWAQLWVEKHKTLHVTTTLNLLSLLWTLLDSKADRVSDRAEIKCDGIQLRSSHSIQELDFPQPPQREFTPSFYIRDTKSEDDLDAQS